MSSTGPGSNLYLAHRLNAEAVAAAFEASCRSCRLAIRMGDTHTERLLERTAALLLGAKIEARLLEHIHFSYGLTPAARSRVLAATTQEDRWVRTITEAFAQRYNLAHGQVPQALDFTGGAYFTALRGIVERHVLPIVRVRNTLAHGQWERALNSDGSAINTHQTGEIATLSLWRLRIVNNLCDHLLALLFDALATKYAFERDFNRRWNNLRSASIRLDKGNPVVWRQRMIDRHQRGAPWKLTAPTGSSGI